MNPCYNEIFQAIRSDSFDIYDQLSYIRNVLKSQISDRSNWIAMQGSVDRLSENLKNCGWNKKCRTEASRKFLKHAVRKRNNEREIIIHSILNSIF